MPAREFGTVKAVRDPEGLWSCDDLIPCCACAMLAVSAENAPSPASARRTGHCYEEAKLERAD